MLRTISGVLDPERGQVVFEGRDIARMPPDQVMRLGICHVPEGREIFPFLTVRENLMMGAYTRRDAAGVARDLELCFDYFPRLKEREHQRAGLLSGGEQQMLAISRALMGSPKLLLLDEPSLGLSPLLVQQIFGIIRRINQEQNVAILLVEQNAHIALQTADFGYVLEVGRIVAADDCASLMQRDDIKEFYLGQKEAGARARGAGRRSGCGTDDGPSSLPPFQILSRNGPHRMETRRSCEAKIAESGRRSPGRNSPKECGKSERRCWQRISPVATWWRSCRKPVPKRSTPIWRSSAAALPVSRSILTTIPIDVCHKLSSSGSRLAFVENEEQLDKLLLIRDRCPALSQIVVFDMKGLRDFTDASCVGLSRFVAIGGAADWAAAVRTIEADQPAVIQFPREGSSMGRTLTHGDLVHMVGVADTRLAMRPNDERLAVLRSSDITERVWGLYLALATRCISNYPEGPDTVIENLQELQPTILGADAAVWDNLYTLAAARVKSATPTQRHAYEWAMRAGRSGGPRARLANLLVLHPVRRDFGLNRLRLAYVGGGSVGPAALDWARSLGITIQRVDEPVVGSDQIDERYRALLLNAYV